MPRAPVSTPHNCLPLTSTTSFQVTNTIIYLGPENEKEDSQINGQISKRVNGATQKNNGQEGTPANPVVIQQRKRSLPQRKRKSETRRTLPAERSIRQYHLLATVILSSSRSTVLRICQSQTSEVARRIHISLQRSHLQEFRKGTRRILI